MKRTVINLKNVVALMTVIAMMTAASGCSGNGKTPSGDDDADVAVTENDSEEETAVGDSDMSAIAALASDFSGRVTEKLGVSEDDISEIDPSTMHNSNAFQGEYYLISASDLPNIECFIYDDASEARSVFEEYYNTFTDEFSEDDFEGEYQSVFEADHGYIVLNGSNTGTHIFGDRFMIGGEAVYAGIYYEGNTVIRIMPKNDIDSVEDAIRSLELPMANGDNC
ncbi:MAG: hypothetical protein J5685_11990 [Clostridiales bacterium]|nr:hypothetical protein [Clostridiales bacterium]